MDVAAAGAAAAAAAATVTVKRENTAAPSPAHQQQQHIITSNSHLLSSYSLTSNYPPPCSTSIVSDKVQSVSLVGLIRPIDPQTLKHTLTLPMFRIKVTRSNYEHCITRRYEDFVLLHNHLKLPNHVGCQMPPLPPPINDSTAPPLWECEAFEARVLEQAKDLNFYLQQLFNLGREIAQVVEAEGVIRFLAPRNDAELDTTKMAQPRILNTSEVKDIVDGSSQSRRRSSILRDFLHATGLDGRSKAIKT